MGCQRYYQSSIPIPSDFIRPQIAPNVFRSRTISLLVDLISEEGSIDKKKLIIIEDLHWMDGSTEEWLEAFLDKLTSREIKLLISTRPLSEKPKWIEHPQAEVIDLQPLKEEDISIITKAKAHDKLLPEDVVKEIHRQTNGNPLFVEEVTLSLLNSNQLKESNESFQVIDTNIEITVPSTLQDALMSRLDNLSESKSIAQLSSVIGREFNYKLINELAKIDEVILNESLQELVANEILYQNDKGDELSFIFKHALIQDTAYNSIVKSEKEQIHRNIAEVYINHFPQVAESQPERIANHLEEGSLKKESLEYWLKGGQIASKGHSNKEAIYLFKRGLKIIEALKKDDNYDELELDFLIGLGGAEIVYSGYTHENVHEAFNPAFELIRRIPISDKTGFVMVGLGVYYLLACNFDRVQELVDFAIKDGEKYDSYFLKMKGYHLQGVMDFFKGAFKSSCLHLEKALEVYDPNIPIPLEFTPGGDTKVNATVWLALSYHFLGHIEKGYKLVNSIQDFAVRVNESRTIYHAMVWDSWINIKSGLWTNAEKVIEKYMPYAKKFGDPYFLSLAQTTFFISRVNQGFLEELDNAKENNDFRINMGSNVDYQLIPDFLEPYSKLYGNYKALEYCNETLDNLLGNQLNYMVPETMRLKAIFTKEVKGSSEESLKILNAAMNIAESQESKTPELRIACEIAKIEAEKGNLDKAYTLLKSKYDWFQDSLEYPDLKKAKALLDSMKAL